MPADPAPSLQVATLTRYKSWQLSLPLESGVSPSRKTFHTVCSRVLGNQYGLYTSSLVPICIFDWMYTETCSHGDLFQGCQGCRGGSSKWQPQLMLTKITCHLPEYQIARDQTATFSDSILTLLTGRFHRYPATSVAPFLILWTRSLRSERSSPFTGRPDWWMSRICTQVWPGTPSP